MNNLTFNKDKDLYFLNNSELKIGDMIEIFDPISGERKKGKVQKDGVGIWHLDQPIIWNGLYGNILDNRWQVRRAP